MTSNERQFEVGQVYFLVTYLDSRLRIPEIVTMVYLGENLIEESAETSTHYFQEANSYSADQRFESVDRSTLMCATAEALSSFMDWDELIDELSRNRAAQKGGPPFFSR